MAAVKVEHAKQLEKVETELDFYRRENGNLIRSGGRFMMSPEPAALEDD